MKRILLAGVLIFSTVSAYAVGSVWTSSNTATADTGKGLCVAGSPRALLHTACVNTGSAGTLTLYNAKASAANPVAAINTAAALCLTYDVALSSGLSYTNSATANVTMTYSCY